MWKPQIITGRSKPGKLPLSWQINKATGENEVKPASCDDPDTWMTFEDALSLLKSSRKYKGLSIALSPEPPQEGKSTLIGVDLDKTVLIDGAINPDKLKEIKSFNTYAELSPTVEEGGLRAFCYGSFPAAEGVHAGNTEIYQYGKFLTITGHKLNDVPATIKDAQEALTAFRAEYFQPLSEIDDSNLPFTSVKFTDNELHLKIGTSKLGAQFKESYYGGYSEADDKSTIDLKLCRMLVFLTQDLEQIDRIFRQSALFRPKWDEIHGHDTTGPLTYGQKTINYALKTRTTVYNPTNVNEPLNDNDFCVSLYPFEVNETGVYKKEYVYNKYLDEPGETIIHLSTTPCVITAIGENIDNGEILYKLKIKDNRHREKIIWKTTTDLMLRGSVTKLLKEGMYFKEVDANKIIEYFDKSITLNKDTFPSEIAASVSGWKNDFSLFVVGNKGISANGEIEVLSQDNPTAAVLHQLDREII